MRDVLEGKYFAVAVLLKNIGERDLETARQGLRSVFAHYQRVPEAERPLWYAQLGREMNVLLYYKAQEYKVNFLQAREHYLQVEKKLAQCAGEAQWQSRLEEMLEDYCALIHADSRRRYSNLIRDCLDYIDRNYAQPLSVEGEAKRLNVSRSYLSYRFVQEMGCSFTDHVNGIRIRYACTLLERLQFPVQRVAEAAGFSSSNYFARIFRKQMGMTPTQYRAKMQKGNG